MWGSYRSASGFQSHFCMSGACCICIICPAEDRSISKHTREKKLQAAAATFPKPIDTAGKAWTILWTRKTEEAMLFVTALTAGHLENHSSLCTEIATCLGVSFAQTDSIAMCLGMNLALLTEQFIPRLCSPCFVVAASLSFMLCCPDPFHLNHELFFG